MATLKELMGDKNKGDGRRFTFGNDQWFEPIFLDRGGEWSGLNQDGYLETFSQGSIYYWEEWTPSNQTKKVELYSPIGLKDNGKIYTIGQYANDKSFFNQGSDKIIGWHKIEIEVDE
jgi:hypothetical protein